MVIFPKFLVKTSYIIIFLQQKFKWNTNLKCRSRKVTDFDKLTNACHSIHSV